MHNLNIQRFLLIGLTIWLFSFLMVFGCERAGPVESEPLAATLSSIQANIFSQNCALSGCHLGASAPFGLDLSEGKAHGNIVNIPSEEAPTLARVKPLDPDNSYLVRKIEGAAGIIGERMPRGRLPLSQEQIDAIREWIAAGAQDN
jgi:hypothetical protein